MSLESPLLPAGSGTAVLVGNICPNGAVIKQSAATPSLLVHRGRALVFDSIEEYNSSRDDPGLPVDAGTVLVVRNAGPRGYPGMPEVGNLQLPRVLLEQGVYDVVRISDARMSGTAYGTVVLHVAPEAAVGGPLSLVRSGDWVVLDVPRRSLNVELSAEELAERQREVQAARVNARTGLRQTVCRSCTSGRSRRRLRLPRRLQWSCRAPRVPLSRGCQPAPRRRR